MYELILYIESGEQIIKEKFDTLNDLLVFLRKNQNDKYRIHITKNGKADLQN